MSQSINTEQEFNLEEVENFIKQRENEQTNNFSFKKDLEPSENDNVFEDVLGKTLHERNHLAE